MPGYFDHNATTPLSDAARQAWSEAQARHWQNPSSLYASAGAVRRLLEEAREAFAERLDCEPERIVFNSGATEGANLVMAHTARTGQRVAISAVEHPCVRDAAWKWFGAGQVLELPVDIEGRLDLENAMTMIQAEPPALVAVMAANNETGVIQPWQEMARFCHEQQIPFLCDAVQWIGKQPLEAIDRCSWVSISAHKFGGPKGIGILVIPEEQRWPLALQAGGPQESGHRGGTENYPAIAAMLAALEEALDHSPWSGDARDQFENRLRKIIPGIRIPGRNTPRLPNTSMAVMPHGKNLKWLIRLSELGFAVSTGSACSAGKSNPSHVMAAMQIDSEAMGRVLRFSSGAATTLEEWYSLAAALGEVQTALQHGSRSRNQLDFNQA